MYFSQRLTKRSRNMKILAKKKILPLKERPFTLSKKPKI
jgi:hypothetical protein